MGEILVEQEIHEELRISPEIPCLLKEAPRDITNQGIVRVLAEMTCPVSKPFDNEVLLGIRPWVRLDILQRSGLPEGMLRDFIIVHDKPPRDPPLVHEAILHSSPMGLRGDFATGRVLRILKLRKDVAGVYGEALQNPLIRTYDLPCLGQEPCWQLMHPEEAL